jgi:hypothetical protein
MVSIVGLSRAAVPGHPVTHDGRISLNEDDVGLLGLPGRTSEDVALRIGRAFAVGHADEVRVESACICMLNGAIPPG